MSSQETVNQRINFLIESYEAGNKSAFGRRVDMKSGVVGDLVGGRLNKPSYEAIVKILSAYPSVNTDWLIKGEGPMLKEADLSKKEKVLHTPYLAEEAPPISSLTSISTSEVTERPDPQDNLVISLSSISEATYMARNNPERIKELIKEAYEIITPEIFKLAARGKNAHSYILYWNFLPNAGSAWGLIRSIPIGLYPQYPALQYLLDFADPYRRIAVFIEESRTPWDPAAVEYQDKILALYGWKVFRIPLAVATTYESDLLPPHLIDVYDAGPENKEQLQERQKWDSELSKKTIDSFFLWLKRTYFQKEVITSIAARKRESSAWDED